MDYKSYSDGQLGLPPGPDTNIDDYMAGKRSGESQGVSGVGFTILLMAPFLYLVYPVLGLTLGALALGVVFVAAYIPAPVVLKIIVRLALCVAAFFPAYKLERKASQIKIYRIFRMVFRLINILTATMAARSGKGLDAIRHLDFNGAPPDTLFVGILVTILAHFVLRTLDRLYFPVWAEVDKNLELEAKGLPFERSFAKRILYSLLWLVPVFAILNLTLRIGINFMTEGPREITAFYARYSGIVYGLDVGAWLVLCLTGILPGTAKIRKSFIDHSALSRD